MRCAQCAFELYLPLGSTNELAVGLYDDGRFPGRLIVALKAHYDHLDEVPLGQVTELMSMSQKLSKGLKGELGAARINVAILGNAEAHVHAHLVPRYPKDEALPSKAPWEDPRPRAKLEDVEAVYASLKQALASCFSTR